MKKVLFITNHYLDQTFGGPNASKAFINAFASIYPGMALIFPDYNGSTIREYLPQGIKLFPCFDNRSKIKKVVDVYAGKVTRYGIFLANHLKSNEYDVIVIDHSKIWSNNASLLSSSKATIITIHHNVEGNYLKDNPISALIRIPYNYYSNKAEREAVCNSDINITLTLNDKEDLKIIYPNRKGNIYYIGAFEYNHIELENNYKPEPDTFIITGNMSFKQTSAPILEFLESYFPVLLELDSKVKLIIAGRNPSQDIQNECKRYNEIELIPNPKNMLPLLHRASYYICPTNKGSGQKLRISDGLKCGIPVICHEKSLSGYEEILKKGYVIPYRDVDSFKKSIKMIMVKNVSRQDIYNAYNGFFSIESGTSRITDMLKSEGLL